MTNSEIQDLDKQYYLPVFKRYPVSLVRGKDCKVWDTDGKEYLDALGGIAVTSTGHCHPEVVKAIQNQVGELMHVSNFFSTQPQAQLAEKLAHKSGLDYTFFINSGAEAVETAIKLARKYAHTNGRGGKIISMKNCFHGRTMATIAAGGEKLQEGYEPIPDGFNQAEIENKASVTSLIDESVAGVIIEPIQGEGGVRPVSDDFLSFLREICDKENISLIFDEIQCGVARTGTFFAFQQTPVNPDIVCLAKGLGSGFPVGATICSKKVANALKFGDHGTTFGGNPMATTAALATLKVIEDEKLDIQAKENGEWFQKLINEEMKDHPLFSEVRGKGLMIGVVLNCDPKPIALKMLDKGVIVNATKGNVVRIVPPLTISKEDLTKVSSTLKEVLDEEK